MSNHSTTIDVLGITSQDGCSPYIDGRIAIYGYVPSLTLGAVFCTLFTLSLVAHIVQLIWKRTWWCLVFALGCVVELMGWAGRTWSSHCPYASTPFLMQISTLIIAPTFFTAGIYILLGRFIALLGRGSSVLSPALYLWIFCTCDLISLVIQAIGGGLASIASNQADGDTKPGTNIMVAGIIIQLVAITVFAFLALDFLRRTIRQGTLRTMKRTMVPLLCAMVLSVICIYIRSIYRTIELLQGWNGYLITTEIFFVILDGAMMVPAVAIFNIIHPGWFMPTEKELDFLTSVLISNIKWGY
ncbi:RTA1 domain containing protein [Elaphomyces granulatus]